MSVNLKFIAFVGVAQFAEKQHRSSSISMEAGWGWLNNKGQILLQSSSFTFLCTMELVYSRRGRVWRAPGSGNANTPILDFFLNIE